MKCPGRGTGWEAPASGQTRKDGRLTIMTADKPCDGVLFRQVIHVPQSAIDQNGHVNNVEYVRWMQEVAIRHSEATGGSAAMRSVGCTWVVRAHRVEYLSPAFAGDCLEAITWVATVERVRSLRRYRFIRKSDGKLLAQGETDWVFVNARTGKPCAIPETVRAYFQIGKQAEP